MSPQLYSALQLVHSQFDWKDDMSITIDMNKDDVAVMSDDHESSADYDVIDCSNNPIKRMMSHITEEVCIDCLKIDYLYKDPFFVSLIKAYIQVLFITFGDEVSISREMAHAFIENSLLGDHKILCVCLDHTIELNKTNFIRYNSDSCIYKLTQ